MSEFRPKTIGKQSRLFLLVLSEINLLLGALFFVDPTQSIPLWPWPVKELAVRFVGAIFLAIAFGCWSVLRADGWQRGKILPVVGGVFYGITAVIIASQTFGGRNLALGLSWILFFSVAALGLLLVIRSHGWYRRPQDRISTVSLTMVPRFFFLIQTAVVGIFGFIMLFFPEIAREQFWPWKVLPPTLQTFAGLFLATCVATGWASRQADKGRILALLPLDAAFPALALLAVGVHWSQIIQESPSSYVTAVWIFLYSFVSAGSFYLFILLRRATESK